MKTLIRRGHAPGHVRDTFLAAVEAFTDWRAGEAEPTVEYEVRYVPQQITLTRACGLLWNCTDIIPSEAYRELRDNGLDVGRQTYAACARAMKASITSAQAAAA